MKPIFLDSGSPNTGHGFFACVGKVLYTYIKLYIYKNWLKLSVSFLSACACVSVTYAELQCQITWDIFLSFAFTCAKIERLPWRLRRHMMLITNIRYIYVCACIYVYWYRIMKEITDNCTNFKTLCFGI